MLKRAADAPGRVRPRRHGRDTLISPSVTVGLCVTSGSSVERGARARGTADRARLEVARLVARGQTNAEIAAELYISPGTAKTHVANIQRKLGARNRVGIATWAWAADHVVP